MSSLVAFLVVASTTTGQATASSNHQHLKALEPLIGVWVGEFETSAGAKVREQRSFEWILNKNFVQVRRVYELDGKSVTMLRIIGWNGESKHIEHWTFRDNGVAYKDKLSVDGIKFIRGPVVLELNKAGDELMIGQGTERSRKLRRTKPK